jgi:hypothetical protein
MRERIALVAWLLLARLVWELQIGVKRCGAAKKGATFLSAVDCSQSSPEFAKMKML